MYFDSLQALITMDGHGAYVWAAYGVTLSVLVLLFLLPYLKHQRLRVELRQRIARRRQDKLNTGVRD